MKLGEVIFNLDVQKQALLWISEKKILLVRGKQIFDHQNWMVFPSMR